MPSGADDISYDVITRGTYFSMLFFYIRTPLRFALIGGNLTAQKYISRNLPNTVFIRISAQPRISAHLV